jgi:aspartate-semialdehyde dehydrogenase
MGATGTVGQRMCDMLRDHPWFEVTTLTGRTSIGKVYGDAVNWLLPSNIPYEIRDQVVEPTTLDAIDADIIFSALPSNVARELEPSFADAGFPVVSNASSFRMEEDVPLVVPEVNPDHTNLIQNQKKNRDWDGFIATDPNCSTINFVLGLKPLQKILDIKKVVVTTLQAISGAGYPGIPSLDILNNVIPFIQGEEEKMQRETQKVLGSLEKGRVKPSPFSISASCNRVPVHDGHLEAIYLESDNDIDLNEVKNAFKKFKGEIHSLNLPTAPEKPVILMDQENRPQTRLDRMAGSVPGMSVTVGRIRHGVDSKSLCFTVLGHNTIRGAAGGTIELAELLKVKNWI